MKLLIVDDDEAVLAVVERGLQRDGDGMEVTTASAAPEALRILGQAPAGHFDLIVLEVNMPGVTGLELLNDLREAGSQIPVIFVTGLATLQDKVAGLGLGADDYIVKPFQIAELRARIRAVLRRRESMAPIEYGELCVDVARRQVQRGDQKLELSPREFDLLFQLVRAKGELVSRETLLSQIWELDFDPGTNVLDVHVGRLRRKLDKLGEPLIENIRGKGYRILARRVDGH
ncbi:MAG: two-component system OmpR family response regulator [Pseudohongiellaceae bacterium]|jgi:two-component system OmpR family response regulator